MSLKTRRLHRRPFNRRLNGVTRSNVVGAGARRGLKIDIDFETVERAKATVAASRALLRRGSRYAKLIAGDQI